MSVTELMDEYIPKKILHRDNQINTISKVFENFAEHGGASNLALLGVTGSGKTSVVKSLIENRTDCLFLNVARLKRSLAIYQKLVNNKNNDGVIILDQVIDLISRKKKVLIIDELNRLEDGKAFFDDLNTIYRETGIPIILVSNNPLILDTMADDARLTLFFEKIIFPAYNAIELYDIAKVRLNELPESILSSVPEESLKYICAVAAKDGSARLLFRLLRLCVLSNDFSIEKIDYFIKENEKAEMLAYISSFNATEKLFLKTLVDLYTMHMQTGQDITTYDIRKKLSNFNNSKISQLITTFEKDYGIITTTWIEKGKSGGRYRIIDFFSQETFSKLEGLI